MGWAGHRWPIRVWPGFAISSIVSPARAARCWSTVAKAAAPWPWCSSSSAGSWLDRRGSHREGPVLGLQVDGQLKTMVESYLSQQA